MNSGKSGKTLPSVVKLGKSIGFLQRAVRSVTESVGHKNAIATHESSGLSGLNVKLETASQVPELILEAASQAVVEYNDFDDKSLQRCGDAYRKLLRNSKAILCYELLISRGRKNQLVQTLTDIYIAAGDIENATQSLNKIDPDTLTKRGLLIYSQSKFTILRTRGKLRAAYVYLRDVVESAGLDTPGVQIKLAEAERQLGLYDLAFERLNKKLKAHSGNVNYALQVAGCASELNKLDQSMGMISMLYSSHKPDPSITLRYVQTLWQAGDVDTLHDVLDTALRQKMSHPPLLKFAREIGYVDKVANRYCERMADIVRSSAATATDVDQRNFAHRFLELNLFEEAREAASIYLLKYRDSAHAFYVRGAANFYLDDNEAATEDLLRSVELNPGLFEAYGLLLHLLPRAPGGLETFIELLDRRDASHPKYSMRGEDGRLGLLDIERSQSSFMSGDFNRGIRVKQERPVCRFLEHKFPEQYNSFRKPAFSASRKDSILIICEDGVGDEIRWAQFYPELRQHFDRIEAMCEPRALSLLQRSFPDIVFHPFKRRLMEAPGDGDQGRSNNVPYYALARLIGNDVYERLGEFSEIRMTSDMVLGMWEKSPTRQPPMDGAGKGSYLTPDPQRRTKWEKHFEEVAGQKVRVGLLWRSSLRTPRRSKHYMDLEDLTPLLNVKGIHFVSLQHEHTRDELLFCRAFGIEILEEADLFEDFEDVAAVTANLDLIVGANSFPAEMGAAVGTPCWQLGTFCNAVLFRLGDSKGEADRLTWNTTIIRTDQDEGFQGDRREMTRRVASEAQRRLGDFVTAHRKENASS
ncbi:hypothetical protein [Stappia sp.]|uniref:hypothetical protein n=1 Tax=Stappia sp. TaxID=1870903 RepID=UPI0032D973F2